MGRFFQHLGLPETATEEKILTQLATLDITACEAIDPAMEQLDRVSHAITSFYDEDYY